MNNTPNVNSVILSSIPIDKNLKRYFLSKYRWLAKHNGLPYACEIFSQMRTVALTYRADPHRVEKREGYISQMPVRKNGWLRKLFGYLDTHPEYVLNFLKLYVGMNKPIVTVEQSANQQDSYLKNRHIDDSVPSYLRRWLDVVTREKIVSYREFKKAQSNPEHWLYAFAKDHTFKQFIAYCRKWASRLRLKSLGEDDVSRVMASKEPLPEMYRDFEKANDVYQSKSLEKDLWDLWNISCYSGGDVWFNDEPALSSKAVNFVESLMTPSLMGLYDRLDSGEWKPEAELSLLDGLYVGHIHHIPKKGTVKRRPIAVPNRFLQMGMTLSYHCIKEVVRKLPKDATFDQSRFDKQITNRVSNPNLYVGSVDLSQATDNLPFSWGEAIVESCLYGQIHPDFDRSWDLFVECSRSKWSNDGILSSWTVGQPLGCLPSFMVLALTHNLILEALAFSLGYGHSPYCVLGDDVVILSKKLRKKYIRDLSNRGIPLSLHKSFEGNLTEFAGKVYIRNHIPFHTSDQGPISWQSLFDYQRATGILIPWNRLPQAIKKRWSKSVENYGLGDANVVQRSYHICQMASVDRCCRQFNYEAESSTLQQFYYHMEVLSDKISPEPEYRTGLVMVGGHPITYLNYGYAEKHGFKQRYRRVELPDWYKDKFRPTSTDKLVQCACLALKDVKGIPDKE